MSDAERAPSFITMGCRLNAAETDALAAQARLAGLTDVVIVNTCAVTAESVRQAAQTIRKAKRDRPQARVIVTGCAAQLEPERFADMPEVDAVIGNAEKLMPQTYAELATASRPLVRHGALDGLTRAAPLGHGSPSGSRPVRTRAIIPVQNGCDHRCTFCIIPFARGRSRSVPVDDVVAHVRACVESGHAEVVLTGVDLTSYGADLSAAPTLGVLVQAILGGVPSLKRLRLSSLDQVEVDEALFEAIASERRLMPHFHLSLQSGDDLILKRMRRRHRSRDAVAFCDRVRSLRSDVTFGADLIAGFPTETEAMFQNTLQAVETCGLTFLHVFGFSPRPGTPAARMPQVAGATIAARVQRLREAGRQRSALFLAAQVGGVHEVLMERGGTGRTPQFAEVAVAPAPEAGSMAAVRITGFEGGRLVGTPAVADTGRRMRAMASEDGVRA